MRITLRIVIITLFALLLSCKSEPPPKPPGALEHILSEDGKSSATVYPDRLELNINARGDMGKRFNTDGVQVYPLDDLIKVKRNGYITSFLVEGGENWTEVSFMPFGSAEGAEKLEVALNKVLEDLDSKESSEE